MSLTTARSVLLWCTLINYGLLAFWGLLTIWSPRWLYQLKGRFYRISDEQFDTINYGGILFYKILIFVFNIVPLIALWIVV